CLYISSFTDPSSTVTYTLSLHDALPISTLKPEARCPRDALSMRTIFAFWVSRSPTRAFTCWMKRSGPRRWVVAASCISPVTQARSEEHTSELQSRGHLVCRLLLEKKKTR